MQAHVVTQHTTMVSEHQNANFILTTSPPTHTGYIACNKTHDRDINLSKKLKAPFNLI